MQSPQPPIPRQSAREPDARRSDNDAEPGDALAPVIGGARRRAVRGGDRQVDTAHLLHSLLESDPAVRAAFGDGPRIARLLGYLVQRSIGYGLRWQGRVEDSGALPAAPGATGFSPLASASLEEARERAAARGGQARGIDLLAALLADPQARAVEVVRRAGIDPREVCPLIGDRPGATEECGETGR
ncbi:Clp protease N-terminal domain-containing protein [Streptomyces sp. NPDC017943]|uniref:Clp protease N-terminal domain-containing protein n=1 Tax=Streptomyces sp. NPDC017943 TaxID=3365019 RepID=UPI00379DDF80